jgi:hypothetical protein
MAAMKMDGRQHLWDFLERLSLGFKFKEFINWGIDDLEDVGLMRPVDAHGVQLKRWEWELIQSQWKREMTRVYSFS